MKVKPPAIDAVTKKDGLTLKPTGEWTSLTAHETEPLCEDLLEKDVPGRIIIDLLEFKAFDTTGVWLLKRTIQKLKDKGKDVIIQNEESSYQILSSRLEGLNPQLETLSQHPSFLEERLVNIGKASLDVLLLTRDLIVFLGQVAGRIASIFRQPSRLRFTSVVAHMESFGVNAIPIVSIMSIALGLVLAYQGEEQLRRFGAEIYTINLVSISIVREVGILITAILVAGRSGSSITAQIGIMKINQEVDALNTLGLNPMDVLVIPRILALILVMPLLAFVSDIAGLIGGGIMVVFSLDVSPQLYVHRIGESITMGGFWVGILKAPLFGAIIGVVSCFEGMRVKGTAESVGIRTTRSVVEGIFLVTIADALLSIFFSKIGI